MSEKYIALLIKFVSALLFSNEGRGNIAKELWDKVNLTNR